MFSSDKFKNTNELYYIGGIVRDEILGKDCFDIDLTYVGNAIEYVKTLKDIEIFQINEPFGTVRIKVDGTEIDIASTRSETYDRAGHLPTVTEIGCNLKTDVLRRDFTINSIAKNFNTGEIIDYTGGLADIRDKKLRVLHDKSFTDDPTRILRGLKFAIRFNFELEEHTKLLQDEYLQNVNYDMSYKRLKKELIETFNLNKQAAYNSFIDNKIYKLVTKKSILKVNFDIESFINKYKYLINKENIWLIYVGLIGDFHHLEPTLTKEELKILKDFELIKNEVPKNDFEIYKLFKNLNIETILLYGIVNNIEIAEKYLDKIMNIKIQISGKALQDIGIDPSPEYKKCFDYIIEKKLSDNTLTKAQEIELAKKFFGL